MRGSKTNVMNRKEVLAAVRSLPPGKDFVWDGKDKEERPASAKELATGVEVYRRKRGRPAGSATKVQVAIRLDADLLVALRATGRGWQTRVNDTMRKWVKRQRAA